MQQALFLLATMLVGTSVAHAGTATITNKGSSRPSTLEYRGADKLRMATDAQGYLLKRDGKLYMVQGAKGQETVIDAGNMLSTFGANAPKGPNPSKVISLKKTGQTETVAGISGEVWAMRFVDSEGKERETDLVLSGDARVRELRDALHGFTLALLGNDAEGIAAAERMIAELKQRGRGMLRFGSDMQVTQITDTPVASARFDLPAEPMAMPDFSSLMGGKKPASSQDAAAGEYLDEKAGRQQKRIEQRADDEVDEASDKAVDKLLNKAFDKLFGG